MNEIRLIVCDGFTAEMVTVMLQGIPKGVPKR